MTKGQTETNKIKESENSKNHSTACTLSKRCTNWKIVLAIWFIPPKKSPKRVIDNTIARFIPRETGAQREMIFQKFLRPRETSWFHGTRSLFLPEPNKDATLSTENIDAISTVSSPPLNFHSIFSLKTKVDEKITVSPEKVKIRE